MPDDIPGQPLLVEIAIEPPITSESSGRRCQHSLRLTVEITGAWLALA
jgi:hypothetical protein